MQKSEGPEGRDKKGQIKKIRRETKVVEVDDTINEIALSKKRRQHQ